MSMIHRARTTATPALSTRDGSTSMIYSVSPQTSAENSKAWIVQVQVFRPAGNLDSGCLIDKSS